MQPVTAVAQPLPSASLAAPRLTIGAAAVFLVALASLHFLEPDLDPSWRVISEYSLGAHGWIMKLAFLSLAVSCVALVAAIRSQVRSLGGRIGLALLLVTAAGMTLAALFDTDPITTPAELRTTSGKLHELGATIDLLPFAALLLGWSLVRRNPAWRAARTRLVWATLFIWVTEIAFIGILAVLMPRNGGRLGPEVPIGWPGRLSLVAHCVWLVAVAEYRLRLERRSS